MARKAKTPAQLRAESLARMDVIAQMEADTKARQAEKAASDEAFMARVEANRQARAAAIEAGEELPKPQVKGLHDVYTDLRAGEKAAELEARRASVREQRENPYHWVNDLPMPPQWNEARKLALFAREAEELSIKTS